MTQVIQTTTEEMIEMVADKLRKETGIVPGYKAAQAAILKNRKENYESAYGFSNDFSKASINAVRNNLENVIKAAQKALDEIAVFEGKDEYSASAFTKYVPHVFGIFDVSHEVGELEKTKKEILISAEKQDAELRILSQVVFKDEFEVYQKAWSIVANFNPSIGFCKGDIVKVEAVNLYRYGGGSLELKGVVSYMTPEYFTVSYTEGEGKKTKTVSKDIYYKEGLSAHNYILASVEVVARTSPNWEYLG